MEKGAADTNPAGSRVLHKLETVRSLFDPRGALTYSGWARAARSLLTAAIAALSALRFLLLVHPDGVKRRRLTAGADVCQA